MPQLRRAGRQDDIDDGDVAGAVERLAERGEDRERIDSGGKAGRQRRRRDHQHRVEAEQEPCGDNDDAREDQHQVATPTPVTPAEAGDHAPYFSILLIHGRGRRP